MDLWTLLIIGCAGWLTLMWKVNAVSEQVKVLRAELAKGKPLTLDEEEAAAFDQPPVKNA